MAFTFGCDPEVFIANTKTGAFVPAEGFVPGDKKNPHPLPNGMVQVDGFAAEFGIRPALTEDEFVGRIRDVLADVRRRIQRKGEYDVVVRTTAHFDKKTFDAASPASKELGCDPDYNAYTGKPNPRPNAEGVLYRTGGGHVHIGWPTKCTDPLHAEHFEACRILTKQLDLYLGVPSLFWDGDVERRNLYGKAGALRAKPYGMEYRTLSNAWLKHDLLIRFVFQNTNTAIRRLLDGHLDFYDQPVEDTINNSRKYMAKILMERFGIELPKPPEGFQKKKV